MSHQRNSNTKSKSKTEVIKVLPSLDENLDRLVGKMLASGPQNDCSVTRPDGNGKIVPTRILSKKELVCVFPSTLTLPSKDGELDDEVTDAIGKNLRLKRAAPGIDWRFKIVVIKNPMKRRLAPQPRLHAGRKFQRFGKKSSLHR